MVHPLVLPNLRNRIPFPVWTLKIITLITYQFSLLLFVCLAAACLWLTSRTYPSPTPPYCTVVGLSTVNIRDSVFSFISLYCLLSTVAPAPIKSFFPTFHFLVPFSLFTFHLPDFLQPACFSACLLFVLPLLFCGRTGELDWRSVWT